MDITALVFDGITTRELIAPIATIEALTDVRTRLVASDRRPRKGFEPYRLFEVDATTDLVESTDLLIVPGGLGSISMMGDLQTINWLRQTAARALFVLSVSTGSLLLAAAGLLDDEHASGHWLARSALVEAGAHPSDEAVTWRGKVITTSGSVAAAEVAGLLPERLLFGPASVS